MCGIAGKISFSSKNISETDLENLKKGIAHRGTDDQGIYTSLDKKVGFVHTRLSIMDLSRRGHQPMEFLKRYVITFNGEIYNFQDLRKHLISRRIKFSSQTDTEVILALYHVYREKCLEFLRGMFAFAIYDNQNHTVFIARDRLGKKPLKYFYNGKLFIFASENRALLSQGEVGSNPDLNCLNDYLLYGYIAAPKTGFEKINKLEPGHYLRINLKSRQIDNVAYWNLNFSETSNETEGRLLTKGLEILKEAVSLRLVADVPVGILLSGGVDSSMILAQMSQLGQKNIHTFSISFKEKFYNESEYAERVAKKFGALQHVITVNSKSLESLPELVYHCGEPTADASIVITDIISKTARNFVKVVLNGDCGDEAFGGYDRYWRLKRDLSLFPNGMQVPIPRQLKNIPKLKRFLENQMFPFPERFARNYGFFSKENLDLIIKQNARKKYFPVEPYHLVNEKFRESGIKDILRQAFYFDTRVYFPDDLLAKADLVSMRYNLEQRSPFTDHKLLEFTVSLPNKLKISDFGETKYLLKKMAVSLGIPKENIYRPKKGFGIPLREWLLENNKKYISNMLLGPKSLPWDIFNKTEIRNLLNAYTSTNDLAPKLWNLLVYSLWWNKYF